MNNGEFYYGYNENNIYLDNTASTLSLKTVKKAVDNFLLNYGSVHRGSGYNSEISTLAYENARNNILNIISGTDEDCVIFTNNTTDAINKFCIMHQDKSKKVLISDIEHSSNLLPWMKYFQVVQFETIDFKIEPEIIEQYLKKDIYEFVAVSASSNVTGYITNIKRIYDICKKYNVKLFVDASQYAPHKIPNLQHADVIAYCGHKMGAPFGAGILAGSKKLLGEKESITGGGNVLYADIDIDNIVYKETPYMQEAGTPNAVGAIAISEAHNFLYKHINQKYLDEHEKKLNSAIFNSTDRLKEYGYEIYFTEEENRTPLLFINNTIKSNVETVKSLNLKYGKQDKSIFCRVGAFCAYNIIEKIKPQLKMEPPIINGKLNPQYSFIRLSAGFINSENDIKHTIEKLIYINKH